MLFLNLAITLLCVWLIMALNHHFLQPALRNRHRFRLYRLRDELALLAMKGEISEESEEYLLLLGLINNAIRATGSFRVTDFLKFMVLLHENRQVHKRLRRVIDGLRNHRNTEYCRIAREYFDILDEIFRKDTRTLKLFSFFLAPIVYVLGLFEQGKRLQEKLRERKEVVEKVQGELGEYSRQFESFCMARS